MSKIAIEKAYDAYPLNESNRYNNEWNAKRVGYQKGYEQAEAETIERACDWLFAHLPILVDYYNEDIHENADRSEFIKLFRKQMEEE